jgi:murein DD-endopeptidase MepM/ murein hydrolase activator NlpD
MRSRVITFLIGFVTGVVALYVFFWIGGVLNPYLTQVRAANFHSAPAQLSEPVPLEPPSPGSLGPTGSIVLPIAGLTASDVLDTFNSTRPGGRSHEATDILAPRGTPVHSMVDGAIRRVFVSKAGGNTIYEFDEKGMYCYYYAHLDRYAEGLREGQHVSRGDVIGYVGTTGNASPNTPHLHLAIFKLGPEREWWKGEAINPYPVLIELLK